MAFNITVVAFGKEPDYADDLILDYRGFDPALIGKVTKGSRHLYIVKTEVPDAQVLHVQIRDEEADSPNMVLVMQDLPLTEIETDPEVYKKTQGQMSKILTETLKRLKVTENYQVTGPYIDDNNVAFTLLDVRKALDDDIAKCERALVAVVKK